MVSGYLVGTLASFNLMINWAWDSGGSHSYLVEQINKVVNLGGVSFDLS